VVIEMNNPFGEILGSDEFREELFIAETQARLSQMLDDKGVSRAELARKLSVSRARVTQIFADDANNLTLKLLARSLLPLMKSH
jgi:transcriptional regulator with XRE-family HTH domain